MKAFEVEFEKYSMKNIKDTGAWRPLSDRQFAKHFYLAATERAAGIAEDEFQHLINGEGLVVPRVAVKAHLETFKERICASKSKE